VDEPDKAIEFRRLAPGWFEAEFFADPSEELRFQVGDFESPAGLQGLAVAPARADQSAEFAVDPTRSLNLVRLAQETGGQHMPLGQANLDNLQSPPTAGGQGPKRQLALWPFALALALAFYLIEILNRRLVNGLFGRGQSGPQGTQA
ncbi:MAG: hypothetical protein KDB61_01785, partial [Planctomycetes bacterium]|nr:hypothetical protein [Planctomycetota bacterium]